ncbi:hypothetical protein P170DRAFT_506509 [Aspergillus steynii IBT 23096]|uniref:Lipocalin-like domain-containing protein n=1 Tax=Aspergillus steynii IBT 23096 TaxID=1392250 RepID=A0A2I2GF40_9EURO|nr:uncharacterized protein P170DRAFT_506509 [Aspergillus steynii IBT 23096]PLB51503.1 hypothetical protein P170DRAFT_506509 [Aspergillus steynii IBT 23096]
MLVYQGKLNTNTDYATEDEVITLTISGALEQGSPAVITGQWTVSYEGVSKENYTQAGTITTLEDDHIELYVDEDKYYWFIGTVSDEKIVLDMKSPDLEDYGHAELSLVYSDQ